MVKLNYRIAGLKALYQKQTVRFRQSPVPYGFRISGMYAAPFEVLARHRSYRYQGE